MWPFQRSITLSSSGILSGITDCHSHLLPGVDDGVQTLDETLQILQLMERQGVRKLWLTPHVMEDIPNTTAHLQQRFAELQRSYRGSVQLGLAAEYMLDNLFDERLAAGDLLSLGDDKPYLLVETSYFNPPMGLHHVLHSIRQKGYFPLLAHPERYAYMEWSDYQSLKQQLVSFQLNLPSLAGMYGRHAQTKAETLLRAGMYDVAGCDTHHLQFYRNLLQGKVRKSVASQLQAGYGH